MPFKSEKQGSGLGKQTGDSPKVDEQVSEPSPVSETKEEENVKP